MSILLHKCRPVAIVTFLLATLAAATQELHEIKPHALDKVLPEVVPQSYQESASLLQESASVVMESNGAMNAASALLRREVKAAMLMEAESKSRRDQYVLAGNNLCDGGGMWKRYELNFVVPGKFDVCAAACDAKDECVGFDCGNTGCNMYTQKIVPYGTWAGVRFNDIGPFAGAGDHDKFPTTPYDLVAGSSSFGTQNRFKCYRKSDFKPAESFYWKIGEGLCSGGGLWKRYNMEPGDYDSCASACNMKDECIGFDVSVHEGPIHPEDTTPGCFLYAQKHVYGEWPGPEEMPMYGMGDHNAYPPTPYDLTLGTVSHFDHAKDAKCFGKTHWVALDSYYMKLGNSTCSGGGGSWKHYKRTGDFSDCKRRCDEKVECIGMDTTGDPVESCRLFVTRGMAAGSWQRVDFDGDNAFAGEGEHDAYAPEPFALSPGAEEPGKACWAKTHQDPPPTPLCDYEIDVGRSDQDGTVWRTLNVNAAPDGLTYSFDGSCTVEGAGGGACEMMGVEGGIRELKNNMGEVVGYGVCCNNVQNAVIATRKTCSHR